MRLGDAEWCAMLRKHAERMYTATLPHYVYCISDGHGKVKIGITVNLEQREKQLKHANPDISIKDFIEVANRETAYKVEGELHECAYMFHVSGEWYTEKAFEIFKKAKEAKEHSK